MEGKYSKITIRETQETKLVKITSDLKPEIQPAIIDKWQSLINLTAEIINVPAGLIMRLNENTIEVFLKSENEENQYEKGGKEKLVHGLYCETVIGTQEILIVPNAIESSIWKDNNPDVDINMISYLGIPVNWPDGEVFGTVCVLDNKENHYNRIYIEFLQQVKFLLETDLELHLANMAILECKNKLEVEIRDKNRILVDFAIDITRKNELILEVKESLQSISNYNVERIDDILRKLLLKLGQQHLINEELALLQQNVEKVNQEFFNTLEDKYPNLTDSEKRICGLIKIGLNSKDIASLYNISIKAVEMSRYRIRKKMGLTPEIELSGFIKKC